MDRHDSTERAVRRAALLNERQAARIRRRLRGFQLRRLPVARRPRGGGGTGEQGPAGADERG
ncbi:hypothetical protein [Kineococcus sp. SYSU DK006]|uniref:hypothetical protein n=1 Tax=Kineococcus sp. SYSU DK006 TaxID=3383127 RepID=UPI003D7DB430